jgi:hypothetical protein
MRLFAAHESTTRVRALFARSAVRSAVGVALAALCLAVSVTAHADKVHLRSGAVLEGKVTREGDKVVVQLESGTIRVDAASVLRIETAVTPLEQITRLRAALSNDAIAERIELANRCREAQLARCERELLEEVIARDSEHLEARARLGYVRTDAGWISREQHAQQRDRVAEREREARAANQRAEILRETAELSRKQAELAVERERLALKKAELEQSYQSQSFGYFPYYYYGHSGYGHHPLHPPSLSPPHVTPYMINGVRAPSEPGFNIPGVRSPASYFP